MKTILSYLWQLPQSLLAWIMMLILRIKYGKPEKQVYKGKNYYWYEGWRNGISLGNIVLLGTVYLRLDIVKHEYGHTVQSKYSGPFYLLTFGLLSGLGNLYSRIFRTKKRGWTREASTKAYYNQPWEKQADKLGGTSWQEHL